jgi:hypothetical protein
MWRHNAFAARSLLTLLLSLGASTASAQQIPEPRDGDIRVVYSDLLGETQVYLTLELKSRDGEKFPVSLIFFSVTYPGKRPAVPPTQIDVRAYVGFLWAPEPYLQLLLDGREAVQFAPPGPSGLYSWADDGASALTGIAGTISTGELRKIGAAKSVGGNVLRVKFELSSSQRNAIASFARRIQSPDPGIPGGIR